MDQVKNVLSKLVKHWFWVVCALMAPALLGGWFVATSKMNAATEDGKQRIKSSFDVATSIRNINPHPNAHSHSGLEDAENSITDEVLAAWKIQYDQQSELLIWPVELDREFIDQVDKYRPIETLKFTSGPVNEIDIQYRELYRNYIQDELPKLAEMIGADWKAVGAAGAGMEGGMEEGGEGFGGLGGAGGFGAGAMGGQAELSGTRSSSTSTVTVAWDPADQARLKSTRFDWTKMPGGRPRTLDILYAQENLWVMQALMRIIAATNEGSTARYNATVKDIKYIQMGREVGPTTSRVQRIGGGTTAPSGGEEGEEDGMSAMAGTGYGDSGMGQAEMGGGEGEGEGGGGSGKEGGMDMGSTDGGVLVASEDPGHYRYVDNNYVPITAKRLRDVLGSENPAPEDAFLVVAKRIPIRIGMTIDHRKLYKFIAACGNSKLVVEVRQVRINKIGESAAGGMDAGGGGMGGMQGGPGGALGGLGGGGGGMGGRLGGGFGDGEGDGDEGMGFGAGGGSTSTFSDVSPYDLPVEIYGMVYIYNPISPRLQKATSQVTAETDLDGGATPAATTDDTSTPATTAPADAAAGVEVGSEIGDQLNQPAQAGG